MKKFSVPLLLQVSANMVVEAETAEEAGKKAEAQYQARGPHSVVWVGPIEQDSVGWEVVFPDPDDTSENNGIEEIEEE